MPAIEASIPPLRRAFKSRRVPNPAGFVFSTRRDTSVEIVCAIESTRAIAAMLTDMAAELGAERPPRVAQPLLSRQSRLGFIPCVVTDGNEIALVLVSQTTLEAAE